MKKTELEALGLNEEQIKAVQRIHGKDLEELRAKLHESPDKTRAAIAAMLPVIRQHEHLQGILRYVNHVFYHEYSAENRPRRANEQRTAADAANIDGGNGAEHGGEPATASSIA